MRPHALRFQLTGQPPRVSWVAAVIAVAIAGATAIWLLYPPRTAAPEAARTARTAASDPARFRPDAWHLPNDAMLGFVSIPAGPFTMGSDPAVDKSAFENERWSAEQAQGTVDVPAFYIGRFEVTIAQFKAFVDATGFALVNQAALDGHPDHPVVNISWPDALAYCRWLEQTLKASPHTPAQLSAALRDGSHVLPPSEAEWEKAARGTDARIYPWGNEPRRDRANFQAAAPMPVGSFQCPECPFGLADMSGNVWEWTRSPYQPYPFTAADDAAKLDADALWVMRGGHFADGPQNVRAAVRGGADPGARRPFIGFRVVITATP